MENGIRLHPSFVFISLFAFSNIFSVQTLLGLNTNIPQIFATLTIASFLIEFLWFRSISIKIFNLSNVSLFVLASIAIYLSYNGVDPEHSEYIVFGKYLKGCLIYFIISNILSSKKKIIIFMNVLLMGSFFLAYWLTHYATYSQGRPSLHISHIANDPNYIALFLGMTFPFVPCMMALSKRWIIKVIYLIPAFFILLGIVVSLSRGAFVAMICGALFFLFKLKVQKMLLVVSIFAIVTIPFAYKYLSDNYINRMLNITNVEADQTGSSGQRKKNMLFGLNYMLSNPISEYGPGNNGYMIADMEQRGESRLVFNGEHVHCNLLQIGADLGLIAFLFFVTFIFSLYNCLRKCIVTVKKQLTQKVASEILILSITLQVCLVIYITGAFFLPVAYDFPLFYLAGVIIALHNITHRFEIKRKSTTSVNHPKIKAT